MTIKVHVGTRKGAFYLEGSNSRDNWQIKDPIFFGNIIYHFVPDPRDPNKALIATKTGHLGPTVFRTSDAGKTWKEAGTPPRFPKDYGKSVNFVFWISPGHKSEPQVWYAGTSPQGLFKSLDGGDTWDVVEGHHTSELINEVRESNGGTPAGPLLHSINVDPSDKTHLIIAHSGGGLFESFDEGGSWKPLNENVRADFFPDPYPEWGHCIHNAQIHPADSRIFYQQNHCGVYKLDRRENASNNHWERIGENIEGNQDLEHDMGFPLIVHPRDVNKIWTVPMDGSDVWPRTSIDGKPALHHTEDGGKTWVRQHNGLPPANAYFTVLRQATAHDFQDPLGIYFGTKSGEVWASFDEGENWQCIAQNLPQVYSLEVSSD